MLASLKRAFGQSEAGAAAAGGQAAQRRALCFEDNAPSWEELQARESGLSMVEAKQRALGAVPPAPEADALANARAERRTFGQPDSAIRIKLYRDHAAWCPYCHKIVLQLEEKRIPYTVELINMRCYGDKPREFLAKVPSGLLPVLEVEGKVLEQMYPERPLLPPEGSPERQRVAALMRLERRLFSDWLQWLAAFVEAMDAVEAALGVAPGPFFLPDFSLVDCTFAPFLERIAASILYYKGFVVRGEGRWPNLERWFAAMEARPAYLGFKSDFFTHVHDLPPQLGGCVSVGAAAPYAAAIDGVDAASWRLPLPPLSAAYVPEPHAPGDDFERVCLRAAARLVENREAVTKFALRGAGQPGPRPVSAPLSDPTALPALEALPEMDAALRHVTHALLTGVEAKQASPAAVRAAQGAALDATKVVPSLVSYLWGPQSVTAALAETLRMEDESDGALMPQLSQQWSLSPARLRRENRNPEDLAQLVEFGPDGMQASQLVRKVRAVPARSSRSRLAARESPTLPGLATFPRCAGSDPQNASRHVQGSKNGGAQEPGPLQPAAATVEELLQLKSSGRLDVLAAHQPSPTGVLASHAAPSVASGSQPSTATSLATPGASGEGQALVSGREQGAAAMAAVAAAATAAAPEQPKLISLAEGEVVGALGSSLAAASAGDEVCSAALIGAVKSFDSAVGRSLTPIKTRSATAEAAAEASPPAYIDSLASPYEQGLLKLRAHLGPAQPQRASLVRPDGWAAAPNRYDPNDAAARSLAAAAARAWQPPAVAAADEEPDVYVSVPGRRRLAAASSSGGGGAQPLPPSAGAPQPAACKHLALDSPTVATAASQPAACLPSCEEITHASQPSSRAGSEGTTTTAACSTDVGEWGGEAAAAAAGRVAEQPANAVRPAEVLRRALKALLVAGTAAIVALPMWQQ
eukprot:scaffold3.g6697.t1